MKVLRPSGLFLKPRGGQTLEDFAGKMLLYNNNYSGSIRIERILHK